MYEQFGCVTLSRLVCCNLDRLKNLGPGLTLQQQVESVWFKSDWDDLIYNESPGK